MILELVFAIGYKPGRNQMISVGPLLPEVHQRVRRDPQMGFPG